MREKLAYAPRLRLRQAFERMHILWQQRGVGAIIFKNQFDFCYNSMRERTGAAASVERRRREHARMTLFSQELAE